MLCLRATYRAASATPFAPGGAMVGPAPTSPSREMAGVWNRETRLPVTAFTAYTPQSGLEPPNTTSGLPFLSVAKAGGDQDPAIELLKPVNFHFCEQFVAPFGSTALIANSAPPSSPPVRPFSPK